MLIIYDKFPRTWKFETDCHGTPIIPFLHSYPIKQTEGAHSPATWGIL